MANNNKNYKNSENSKNLEWPKNIPNYMCGVNQKILSIVKNDVGWPTIIRVADLGSHAIFDISYYMSGAVMTIRKTTKQVKTNIPVVWECTYSPDNRLIFEHTNHDKDSIPSFTFGQEIQRTREGNPQYGVTMFNRVLFKKDNGTAPESTKVFDKLGRTVLIMEGDDQRHYTYKFNGGCSTSKALTSYSLLEKGKLTIYNFEYNDANLCTYASCTENGKLQYETFITRDSVADTIHHIDYSNKTEWWAPLGENGFEPTPGHLGPTVHVYFKREEEYEEYRKKELNKLSMREMFREMGPFGFGMMHRCGF